MMISNKTKYIILVGDGMGDLSIADLGGKTPLEKAETPAMDYIASHGELALLKTIPEGYPPGSDVANLSLLGYLPEKYYTGRAPLEAASMGVHLGEDEIAFRCNLVTVEMEDSDRVRMIDYSADHISTEEAKELIETLDKELASDTLRFYPGVSYRHLMVLKSAGLDLTTVPPHDHTGRDVSVFWQKYLESPLAETVLRAHAILTKHEVNRARIDSGKKPANSIWLWGEGKPPSMPTLKDQYGISGSLISAVDLLKGIGVYAGLDIINVPGATGYLDTNYNGKAQAALNALEKQDFVLVHVEAPDETGHQGSLEKKIQAIEDFDKKIVKPIFEELRKKNVHFRMVVAMDHFTPLSIRTHSDEPVPVALYDSKENNKCCGLTYNESNSKSTGVTYNNGEVFIRKILELEED